MAAITVPTGRSDSFLRRAANASLVEAIVASRLAQKGFWVVQAPANYDPQFDVTTPDLRVSRGPLEKSLAIEVKGISGLWPEFVCSAVSWDRKYGDTHVLTVPYVFMHKYNMSLSVLLPGAVVRRGMLWDRNGRNEVFGAILSEEARVSFGEFVRWLERNL